MDITKILKSLPDSPGVYLMKNANSQVLYIGKAANLKRRVSSYFQKAPILRQDSSGPRHDTRIEKLVSEIADIETRTTDSALEALILESKLIKELEPPYNIREKDDKSFLYVEITKEKFPRVLLVRALRLRSGQNMPLAYFGPFTSAGSIREALKILRRIFPWSTHLTPASLSSLSPITSNLSPRLRPCFEYELGLCPGTCIGAISQTEYRKNINNLKLFLKGEKARIITSLTHEMAATSKKLDFERAAKMRKQIFALQHIHDTALISENELSDSSYKLHASRVEGYDISNISGTSAVGSMVVFVNGKPAKSEYRKFKIRSAIGKNPASSAGGDVGMMKEMLERRFENKWGLPNLILVDGGAGQVRVAKNALKEFGLQIPVVGIAKGPERKRNDFIGFVPKGIDKKMLIHVRDEAHRFAIQYHRVFRSARFLS